MTPVRIVHISDLHFVPGHRQKDEQVWNSVRDFINNTVRPHAVLVTGDVTDSATHDEFTFARRCLDSLATREGGDRLKFRIVAGNHDRFLYRGNRPPFGLARWMPSRWPKDKQGRFDSTFHDHQVTHKSQCDLELRASADDPQGMTWRVRVLGFDSSADEKWFAQGHVNPNHINAVCQSAATASKMDLVIAMVHHHILPIPAVEERKGQLEELVNATGMLNAGAMIEALSRNQVDLVVHGHEHAPHQARFAGSDELATDVALVSAGSGTGDVTLGGWSLNRVHFNVIELDPDRSVWLRQVEGRNGQLHFKPGRKALLWSNELRLSQFIRRNRALTDPTSSATAVRDLPQSRIRKVFEFKANRDVEITDSRTDWQVLPKWQQLTSCSSGFAPNEAIAQFEWADGGMDHVKSPAQAVAGSHNDHLLEFASPNKQQMRLAKCVNVRWKWTAAAVYTQAELAMLPATARGGTRTEGKECASILCSEEEVQELVLTVKLPSYFSPRPSDVEAYYEEPDAPGKRHRTPEMARCLEVFGAGNMELRVPYPLPRYRYGIAWKVTDDVINPASVLAQTKALTAQQGAIQALMQAELAGWQHDAQPHWDVYVYHPDTHSFRRHPMGDRVGAEIHPIKDARSVVRAAAWGDPIVVAKDDVNGRYEFQRNEIIVSYLPLLRRQDGFGFAPAVLRLSFASQPFHAKSLRDWVEEAQFFTSRIKLLVNRD